MNINRLTGRTATALSILFLSPAILRAAAPTDAAYHASVEQWRRNYEKRLRSEGGWLSLAGLFWLHPGENRFGSSPLNDIVLPASAPADAGSFDFHDGKTGVRINPGVSAMINGKAVQSAELRPDSKDSYLVLGDLTLLVHASGLRYAIRILDKNSPLRRNLAALRWFPIDESYRVTARYFPYNPPKKIKMPNIMGDWDETMIVGYAIFSLKGQEARLEAEKDDAGPGLSFTLRDLTSGHETYPTCRFLVTGPPKDGAMILDFNETYNPPCAYSSYTTCPLAMPENRLKIRVEAGEKIYRGVH